MKGPLDVEGETWMRLKETLPKRVHSFRRLKGKLISAVGDCWGVLILKFDDGTWMAITADEDCLENRGSMRDWMNILIEMKIADRKEHDKIKANMERCAKKHENMDEREEYLRLKKIYEGEDPPVGLPPGTKFRKIL